MRVHFRPVTAPPHNVNEFRLLGFRALRSFDGGIEVVLRDV
jgi:hypothetical protein